MTYEQMAERAKKVSEYVLGKVNVEYTEADKFTDGEVSFDGVCCITKYDELSKSLIVDASYQLFRYVNHPGVMYHSGSGTPPETELVEVGKPHKTFDAALVAALKLVFKWRLEDFLSAEAESKLEGTSQRHVCFVCGRETRFKPCDVCGHSTCQDCGPCSETSGCVGSDGFSS